MTWLTRIIVALTVGMLILMVYSMLKEPHYIIEVLPENTATTTDGNGKQESKKTVNTETSHDNNEKPVTNIEQPKPKTVIPAIKNHKLTPEKPPTNAANSADTKKRAAD